MACFPSIPPVPSLTTLRVGRCGSARCYVAWRSPAITAPRAFLPDPKLNIGVYIRFPSHVHHVAFSLTVFLYAGDF